MLWKQLHSFLRILNVFQTLVPKGLHPAGCWGVKSWLCHLWCLCLWFLKMSFSKWSCSHLRYLLPASATCFPQLLAKLAQSLELWILCLGLHQQCNLHPPCLRHRPLAEEGARCWEWGDLSLPKPSGLVYKDMGSFRHCRAQHSDAQTLLQLWLWETCLSHAASQQHPAGERQVSWLPAQCSSQSLASTCFVPKSTAICIQWNKLHYTLFLKRTSELLFISIWLSFYSSICISFSLCLSLTL